MSKYIKDLISTGENQRLDFKFEISDSKKIARTFVAFANTDGGKLLIGVKDNGVISGIRSEEEYYMVEAAAEMYCKPEIVFKSKEWNIDGKAILEITIPKSKKKPHYAPDKDGNWMAWIRVNDQNILANDVLLKVWKKRKKKKGILIKYSKNQKILLDYLTLNESITLTKYCKIAKLNRFQAKAILVEFISIDIIEPEITEKSTVYKLKRSDKI